VPVIAFNAAYDFTVLDRESRRQQVDRLDNRLAQVGPVVDPHVMDKAVDKYRKGKRTLTACCEHYGVRLDGAHDATADALGAARVAFTLAERYPEQLQVDLPRLHTLQQSWRAEQAASLQAYFRKKDPTAVVNGDWPVQALPSDWAPGFHPAPEPAAVSS
jgi:DNA polymerase III subunit epsilon